MSSNRSLALAAGVAAFALVLAQIVVPAQPLYHDWRYAAALTIVAIPLVAELRTRGAVALASLGALVVVGAGMWSGLAGADTETVIGAPGTTTAIGGAGVAAAFPPVSGAADLHGDAAVTVRTRGGSFSLTGGAHRTHGPWVFALVQRPAALIEARDARGAHLTVTQPQNASFLSSVLLFRAEQPIRDERYPLDTFATPALHRIVRALYFSATQLATFRHGVAPNQPALVLTATDDGGKPLGIALAASGETAALGDLRIRPQLGRYPALVVASAPEPLALWIGALLYLAGAGLALYALFARRETHDVVLSAGSQVRES